MNLQFLRQLFCAPQRKNVAYVDNIYRSKCTKIPLLFAATRAVEIAIEQDEAAGMDYLRKHDT